ncbi:MAG TPA: MAPEG family protein [Gammaproteobacteria bacterium]
MKTEMTYLVWVTVFTGLLWIPYVLNRITVRGLVDTVGYPERPKPLAPWAARMKAAHMNAVENLVIFAPLAIAVHVLDAGTAVTATAAMIYFWARVVHFFVYAFAIPWLRTLAFAVGFGAQIALAWVLLGAMG